MPGISPLQDTDGVLTVAVEVNGRPIPASAALRSATVERTANGMPSARLVFADGDIASGAFALSDAVDFEPGARLAIKAGYGPTQDLLFAGIVVRQGLQIRHDEACLVVECRDAAVRMTVSRHHAGCIDDNSGSDILRTLIEAHGLVADVQASPATPSERVQHFCNDWDFLLARAEAHGLLVIAKDGSVTVKAPVPDGEPVLTVTHGTDLMAFSGDIDARDPCRSATAVSWDPSAQSLRARLRGQLCFQGSAKAQVGALIELRGVGRRFSGPVFITGLRHHIEAAGWKTEADFGLEPGRPCNPPALGDEGLPGGFAAPSKDTKGPVTRSRHWLEFDEQEKVITLTTPGGNRVVLNDQGKSALLQDGNGNTVELSPAGISLDSPRNITLKAQGDITLDAVNHISLSAKADVKASGLNVRCEAQVGFTGTGSATAELSASGQTVVRGALVLIN